jgi:autotransporter-associated beta strand protein
VLGGILAIDTVSRLGTRTAALDATGYLAIKQGGTLRYSGTTNESTTRRLFMDNGAATIDVVNADTTLTWDDDSNAIKNGNFTKAGAGTLTLADPLTGGSQTITVDGGSLILTGANTNGGGVTINAGTLQVNNSGRLGAGAIVNNGQLQFFYGGGVNVVLSQAISGTGSIVKNGAGSLSLSGAVSSSGSITAQGGTLRLQSELAAPITIGDGATLATGTNASIGFAAAGLTGSLTLAGGSSSVFRIDTGTNHDRFYVDQENQLTISGTHTITPVLVGTPATDEAFPVIDYVGSFQGNFEDFQLPPGTRFELVNNIENTSIDLVYRGGELLWSGGTGDWDIDLTPNWTLGGSSTNFYVADRARFDDTATSGAVNLVGTIAPFTTTFQNETLAYTLSGAALSGTGSVVKSGAATTTFLMASSYSGTTTVNAGKLRIGDGGTTGDIGSGAITVASGATLELNRSNAVPDAVDLDYKITPKLRKVSGAGDVVLTGGAILCNYPGAGLGFTETNSWDQFSGILRVKGNSEFRTIRNGSTAMGTGSIVLGDGTSNGFLSQIEGSWTWTNSIAVEGAENAIINRSAAIAGGRIMKLQGVISGSGGLRLRDATATMTDVNKGYVMTASNTLSGTLTIDAGVPLRVGGLPGNTDVTQLNADAFGSLGGGAVVNHGTLTFSRTDAHTVTNAINGSGSIRIGIPAAANLGNTSTQVVTYTGQATYAGSTTVNNGTLLLDSGASIAGSTLTVSAGATLGGAGTITAAVQVAGTLSPGQGVGTLTLGATTLSGSYVCDVNGTQSDRLTAGDLNLTGSTLQIQGTPTASSYTIATYTGTLVGSFGGTLPDGYELNTSQAGEIRLVKSGSDFSNWLSAFFPGETNSAVIGLNADPDADGIPNGVEFVLKNGNPAEANGTVMPTSTRVGDVLIYRFERDDRAKGANAGVTLTVEAGNGLQSWPKSYAIGSASQSPVSITNDTDSGPDTVTVEIPLEGAMSQFARLKVTLVSPN